MTKAKALERKERSEIKLEFLVWQSRPQVQTASGPQNSIVYRGRVGHQDEERRVCKNSIVYCGRVGHTSNDREEANTRLITVAEWATRLLGAQQG